MLGINPLNGQPGIPSTASVIAVLSPQADCLVADTWTNVVTEYIDPSDPSRGLKAYHYPQLSPMLR